MRRVDRLKRRAADLSSCLDDEDRFLMMIVVVVTCRISISFRRGPTLVFLLPFLLRRGEFRHGLGTFRYGVFGQFTGQHKTNGRLDFATAQGRFFIVRGKFSRFGGDTFKNIVNERIHDAHTLFRNPGIGMDLFKHFVNVRAVRFRTLLVLGGLGAGALGGLGRSGFATTSLGWSLGHGCCCLVVLSVAREMEWIDRSEE
jgi:hypothetical protein